MTLEIITLGTNLKVNCIFVHLCAFEAAHFTEKRSESYFNSLDLTSQQNCCRLSYLLLILTMTSQVCGFENIVSFGKYFMRLERFDHHWNVLHFIKFINAHIHPI